MSIIGYDNNEFSTVVGPAMCTVDNHIVDIGRKSAQMLIDILGQSGDPPADEPQEILYSPQLVWRDSVATLPNSRMNKQSVMQLRSVALSDKP